MDIIFDIDGTVADASERLPFVTTPGQKKDWDAFFDPERLAADKPIEPVWAILTAAVANGDRVIFMTSRTNALRSVTYKWLNDLDCPIRGEAARDWKASDEGGVVLYMRPDGDRRASHIVKAEMLGQVVADGYRPRMAFDDRKSDADMFRSHGLICALLSEGDF